MQYLGKLVNFTVAGSLFGRLVVKRSSTESPGKQLARSGSHARGSVAMEVVVPWNDARQKSLSDVVFSVSGMRCVVSSASVWCNANDTVEDALRSLGSTMDKRMRFMWEEKKASATSIVTTNVYHHYAKFTHVNEAHFIVVDVVHPKHEVGTLCLDTKLWRAKEMMNERRLLLEKEARKTRNVFGEYTEVIWRGSNNFNQYDLSRLQVAQENRLWLEIRTRRISNVKK